VVAQSSSPKMGEFLLIFLFLLPFSGGSTWRPHVTPTGNVPQPNSPYLQTVTKTSLAHKQQDSQHIGCGYNNAARPFVSVLICNHAEYIPIPSLHHIIYKIHKLAAQSWECGKF